MYVYVRYSAYLALDSVYCYFHIDSEIIEFTYVDFTKFRSSHNPTSEVYD